VVVADIGIIPDALGKEGICVWENHPSLWRGALPFPDAQSHKYARGHAVVQGGGSAHTGAARLAARAALRGGAGAVTIACDAESLAVYAVACEAVMTRVIADENGLIAMLKDPRMTAYLIGPGAGVGEHTLTSLLTALALRKPVVIDADAISVAAHKPQVVFDALHSIPAIITPHAGEFKRLFGEQEGEDKITAAQRAAAQSNAVIIYKGADTVIAAPDGRAVVNSLCSPWLATAGSGDVLAGICSGLLAANMPAFEAACAAVWMHGAAAHRFGAGLIAEDLPDILPDIWQYLEESDIDDLE
jgi:NAD(P)H-hydrate epimerase